MNLTILRTVLGGLAITALAASGLGADAAQITELRTKAKALLGPLPDKMPGSEKDTPAMVKLGRALYFEKDLSMNRSQSCNSCHAVDQGLAGVDNEKTSDGAFGKKGGRNSPTVLNAGFQFVQFWDGRAATLEDQAKGPVLNPIEMAMPNEAEVLRRLKASQTYPALFRQAFPAAAEAITYDNYAHAVAAFERTLITRDRLDDFLKGSDTALSAAELKGLDLFLNAGCTTCHNGPVLGGNAYHKMGLVNAYQTKDQGRFDVTKDEDDQFKFKVPMLRNIALTHPYFHDGTQTSLEDAVAKMGWLQLGKDLTAEEVKSLVAFLNTLTDKGRTAKKQSVVTPKPATRLDSGN
jgi:cytochrome c peroxidase